MAKGLQFRIEVTRHIRQYPQMRAEIFWNPGFALPVNLALRSWRMTTVDEFCQLTDRNFEVAWIFFKINWVFLLNMSRTYVVGCNCRTRSTGVTREIIIKNDNDHNDSKAPRMTPFAYLPPPVRGTFSSVPPLSHAHLSPTIFHTNFGWLTQWVSPMPPLSAFGFFVWFFNIPTLWIIKKSSCN